MFKPFDLSGKVALVTGGNGGIGLAMADAMAQAGADVVIWGRNAQKNDVAEKQLKVHGTRVLVQAVNVAEEDDVISGMDQLVAQMGRLDMAVANAGIVGTMSPVTKMTKAQYREVIEINQDGVFFTLREAARHMVDRVKGGDPGGSLVGVASVGGIHGSGRTIPYGTSKGAVLSIVRGFATELGRYGIRANTVVPGWTATDISAMVQDDPKYNDNVISRVPLKGWGKPEDFGGIAVYLASDASRFHTGDTIAIDGGYLVF